jgi:uncharacterized protein YfbU (UPF0304 family)
MAASERFEMRLDGEILGRVDKWRATQGDVPTRAEAMRRLIDRGLAGTSQKEISLSDGEKLLAIMLCDLYKHLKLRGEIEPEFISEVIYGGHSWALSWVLQGLFHGHEDDPREVRHVVDVLDMWFFLETAYEKLPKKEKSRVQEECGRGSIRFAGFDGNNETSQMAIARFMVDVMKRFSHFKGREFNSHMPTYERYSRMLQVFEPLRKTLDGIELSPSQIISIMNAE